MGHEMIEVIPRIRVRRVNQAPIVGEGGYVLYWMTAHRRTRHNFSLQHAAWHAERLGKPLLVFEALGLGYRWASERLHRFVIDGMLDNAERFGAAGVAYYAFVERSTSGEGRGLLQRLGEPACLVVTDEYPAFFYPQMIEAAGRSLSVCLEAVDANGLLPLQSSPDAFERALDFRRFLQREAAAQLGAMPMSDPLTELRSLPRASVPADVRERWPALDERELEAGLLGRLAIDHDVAPVGSRGGSVSGERRLQDFLDRRLDRYTEGRNHPDDEVSSGLSPWLHFGHVGAHELIRAVLEREGWDPGRLGDARRLRGARLGFWGVSEAAESFLDQAVTWRELGFHHCWHREGYDRYEGLPGWAKRTLAEHADDPRPHVYTLEQLEAAQTHDELWNASQRQLVGEGRIHNYLRMLWGKKILEWSPSPQRAFEVMVELNNKYALDGRDPNSYSGIAWVLGRFDRPWGPDRPIFGKIRYMSSDNTRKKLELDRYLERWGDASQLRIELR